MHCKIRKRCSGKKQCRDNCSSKDNNVDKWCNTCYKWREEMFKYMRHASMKRRRDSKWLKFNSSTWEDDVKGLIEVGNVFVYDCHNPHLSGLGDIKTILSILENCTYFDIGRDRSILERVREIRNTYFAHNNQSFMVGESDLQTCLNYLIDILTHKHIKHKQCADAASEIFKLKNREIRLRCEAVTQTLSRFEGIRFDTANTQAVYTIALNYMSQDIKNNALLHKQESEKNTFLLSLSYCMNVVIMIAAVCICVNFLYSNPNENKVSKPQTALSLCEGSISFQHYIEEHEPLVGREWILEEFSKTLHNTTASGLILLAGMGFGKSAIVSHITRDTNMSSPGFLLHKNLVAFHMCKFTHVSTLKPENFVRNLACGIAKRIPKFKDMLTENRDYLNKKICAQDFQSCFDQVIVYPLKKIDVPDDPLIVIVDALDECIEIGNKNIFTLLSDHIILRPSAMSAYLKFLFTSRKTSAVYNNLPPGIIQYEYSDIHNVIDMRKYIQKKVGKKLMVKLSDDHKRKMTEKVLVLADGNFLFIKYILQAWLNEVLQEMYPYTLKVLRRINVDYALRQNRIPTLKSFQMARYLMRDKYEFPSDLNGLLQLNIKRMLSNSHIIPRNLRLVIEILCAASHPISEQYLYALLNISEVLEQKDVSDVLTNDLFHFVSRDRGDVFFTHKGFSDLLCFENVDDKRQFSKVNGHLRFANYLIKNFTAMNGVHENDLIEFSIHVACLNDISQMSKFINNLNPILNITLKNFPDILKNVLFKSAAKTNSYRGMNFLLKITTELTGSKNNGDISAALFIAASNGHERVLKALLDNGAEVNYIHLSPDFTGNVSNIDIIEKCKYETFCGYSPLHIASQNGHEDVVKLLLQYGADMDRKTTFGSTSFELASERGHVCVLRELLFNSFQFQHLLQHSLYLASKSGYAYVVEFLLYHGAVDLCLPCNGSAYWIGSNQKRMQSVVEFKLDDKENYVLKDDRQYLFCETALEIAIQNRWKHIVDILIKTQPNTLHCRDARGRTPLGTAALFYQEIVPVIESLSNPSIPKCSEIRNSNLVIGQFERKEYYYRYCDKHLMETWFSGYTNYSMEIK